MKKTIIVVAALLAAVVVASGQGKFPLYEAYMATNLDGNAFAITNFSYLSDTNGMRPMMCDPDTEQVVWPLNWKGSNDLVRASEHNISDHATNYVRRTGGDTIPTLTIGSWTFDSDNLSHSGSGFLWMLAGDDFVDVSSATTNMELFYSLQTHKSVTVEDFLFAHYFRLRDESITTNYLRMVLTDGVLQFIDAATEDFIPEIDLGTKIVRGNAAHLTNVPFTSISGAITVTQKFLDASSVIRTNVFINGVLITGYTE